MLDRFGDVLACNCADEKDMEGAEIDGDEKVFRIPQPTNW
jgi:hypothetical protein